MRVYPEGEFQIITLCRGETFFGFESDKEGKRLLLGPKMLHRQIGWTVWIDGSQTITDSHGCRIFTAKGGVENLPNNEKFQSIVGGLLYLSVNTWPDIAISTSILGR